MNELVNILEDVKKKIPLYGKEKIFYKLLANKKLEQNDDVIIYNVIKNMSEEQDGVYPIYDDDAEKNGYSKINDTTFFVNFLTDRNEYNIVYNLYKKYNGKIGRLFITYEGGPGGSGGEDWSVTLK